MGRDDVEQHCFMCEAIWYVKGFIDVASKIMQQETTSKDRTLTWYMKYKVISPMGQARYLANIKRDILR
jgi:hypothetical protein